MTAPPLGRRVQALLRREGIGGVAARGSLAAFTITGFGFATSFALQVSLARSLGELGYSTYTVVIVWMNVLLLFTKFDLDIVTTRFVGAYSATADWARLHGLLRYIPRRVFAQTALVAAAGGAALLALRGSRFDHFVAAGLLAGALFVLSGQVLVRGAALQGFKRVVHAQVPNVLLRPALILAAVALAVAFGTRLTPAEAVAANAGAALVALLVSERYLRRATPNEAHAAAPRSEMRLWLRTGYSLLWISAAQITLSQSSDILLVAALLDQTNAAYYTAATQLATMVAFASTAVMFIVAPLISELYARQELARLRSLTRSITTVCLITALVPLLGIVALGEPLLGIYGGTFTVAYPTLVVLGVSQFVSACIGALAGWLMTMTGRERPAAWMIGGSALLNIALSVPLTLAYGLVGTALATLLATVARSLVLSVYLRRNLGLSVIPGAVRI
ncbi:MAG: oligosaccharide flippase family protein [Gemmatimonadaceae bacterium]